MHNTHPRRRAEPILAETRRNLGDRAAQAALRAGQLAQEGAKLGITVNAVAPGYVDTEMVRAVPPDVLEKIIARIPRGRLLQRIRDRRIRNTVVLTGDEHQNYAGELYRDSRNPEGAPIASEFVSTSISSSGDGQDQRADGRRYLADNPFLKFNNAQRGYVVCDVTPERWQTEFKGSKFWSTTPPKFSRWMANPMQLAATLAASASKPPSHPAPKPMKQARLPPGQL